MRSAISALDDTEGPEPGHVEIVVGDLTAEDRSRLRSELRSFLTSDGAVELFWPHLRVSERSGRVSDAGVVSRTSVPLRGSHARVAQSLLARQVSDGRPYDKAHDLARDADVTAPTVSHVLAKLEDYGLVERVRHGRSVSPYLIDPAALARGLHDNSAFATAERLGGYVYGRDMSERVASLEEIARKAATKGHEVAITGFAAAATYGVTRTGIERLDVWLRVLDGHQPHTWMLEVGIEPLTSGEGPLRVGVDRTGAGVLRAKPRTLLGHEVPCAERVRVWVDVQDGPRGPDIADQLHRW